MGGFISHLVFQPPPPTYMNSARYIMLGTTLHNRIPAFFINRRAEYTILFSHGNAEDLGMIYNWFEEVSRRLNVNVMAYDYAGYGISHGECTEESVYADVEAAFAYLTTVKNIAPSRIILYGRSLGSGPTVFLARKQSKLKNPVAGVILQSPLLSVYRIAFHFRFTLAGDMFCNIDRIGEIESPVTIIHGTRDEVVPFWHGEELFEHCHQKWRSLPFWVVGAGHNNIESILANEDDLFFKHLKDFVSICDEVAQIKEDQQRKSGSFLPKA